MYKFICANINKSRSFTISYRKLIQAKKVHQDISRPYLGAGRKTVEESQGNRKLENIRSSTAPARMEQVEEDLKLHGFKALRTASHLKMRDCSKFFTGNCIIANPPTPCISKKYYHVYSITPPAGVKHHDIGTSKYFINEEAKKNYKTAMETLRRIERKKPASTSSKTGSIGSDPWIRMHSRKSSKTEITYPTHTAKHNLTLTKRYRIREGSIDGKIRQMDEQFNTRKKLQTKIYKNMNAKKITVDPVKKGKYNTILVNPEYRKEYVPFQWACNSNNKPQVGNNLEPAKKESQDVVGNKLERQEKTTDLEKDFESLIKSHPTIENASKEVKMKLKTRFIQLLLKTSNGRNQPATEMKEEQHKETGEKVNKISEEKVSGQQNIMEAEPQTTILHPQILNEQAIKDNSVTLKYPKRVLVDNVNNYDVENVCIKETASKIGSGLITGAYAKEPPKLNYKNVNKEAQKYSKLLEKITKLQTQSGVAVEMLQKGKESSENTMAKLEELKRRRLYLLKELKKIDVTFSCGISDVDATSMPKKKTITNRIESLENTSTEEKKQVGSEPSKVTNEKLKNYSSKNISNNGSGLIQEVKKEVHEVAKMSPTKNEKRDRTPLQQQLIEKPPKNFPDTLKFDKHEPKQETVLTKTSAKNDRLEDVEQTNDLARTREERFQNRRTKTTLDTLKRKVETAPTKPLTRIEKTVAHLQGNVRTGVKVKKMDEVIPNISPRIQHVQATRNKPTLIVQQTAEMSLDEPSRYDELNKIAETLTKNYNAPTSASKGYALEQPEVQKDVKLSLKMQENDLKLEQDEKVKQDLDAFYRKKNQEWEDAELKTLQKKRLKEKINKKKGLNTTVNSHEKIGIGKDKNKGNNKLATKPKEAEAGIQIRQSSDSSAKNNATINTVANPKQSNVVTGNDDPLLTKQTKHLLDVIHTTLSKKIVSPILQDDSALRVKQIENLKGSADITAEFKDSLLKEYFQCKNVPCSDQIVYLPKEKLVVHNIREIQDNKSDFRENGETEQKPDEDIAVLRPGDQILFLEKDVASQSLNLSQGETASKPKNVMEEALSLENDTNSKIDIMMEKIKDLENLFKVNQLLLAEEKKSENKPRVITPKPPIGKDKKDIRKDKPKGPNDIVLPPRTSKSESVPKEQKQALIKDDRHPRKEQPKEVLKSLKSVSHPNVEPKNVELSTTINQKKLENLSLKLKKSLAKGIENEDNLESKLEKNNRETGDNAHNEKIKKYFTRTYGIPSKDSKEPQVVTNDRKKLPKKTTVQQKAVKNSDENIANNGLKMEMSASQKMVTQNMAKVFRGKLVSAPSAGSGRPRQGLEVGGPLQPNNKEKPNSKAPIRPTVVKFGGTEETKTKYSSWTKLGKSGSRLNSYSEHNNFKKSISKGSSIAEVNSKQKETLLEANDNIESKTEPTPKSIQSKLTSDKTKLELNPTVEISKDVIIQNLVENDVEQQQNSNPLKALPKVFWAKENVQKRSSSANKVSTKSNSVIELFSSSRTTDGDAKNTKNASQFLPKIIWATKSAQKPSISVNKIMKKENHVLEMSKESPRAMPKISWNKNKPSRILNKDASRYLSTNNEQILFDDVKVDSPNKSTLELPKNNALLEKVKFAQNTDHIKKPDSKVLELCMADCNLRQANPIGTVNILLPTQTESSSWFGGKKPIQNVTSSNSKTKVSNFTKLNLGNDGNVISKAGISTTSQVRKTSDKLYTDRKKPQKKGDDKVATFKIKYNGEVLILKKADKANSNSRVLNDDNSVLSKKTKNYVDMHVSSVEPKLKVKPNLSSFTESDYNDSVINKNMSPNNQRKLVAKIRQIIVKPQKEDGLKEDLKTASSNNLHNSLLKNQMKKGASEGSINEDKTLAGRNALKSQKRALTKKYNAVLSKSDKNIFKTQPSSEANDDVGIYLNKKYAEVVKKVEEHLAAKRKNLELKREEIKEVTKILNSAANNNSSVTNKQVKHKNNTSMDPFKDISYHGTVKKDCADKPIPNATEANDEKVLNSLYILKVPKVDEPVPEPEKASLSTVDKVKPQNAEVNIANNNQVKHKNNSSMDPFKDISYYGTVNKDFVDKPISNTTEANDEKLQNSLYIVKVPELGEPLPELEKERPSTVDEVMPLNAKINIASNELKFPARPKSELTDYRTKLPVATKTSYWKKPQESEFTNFENTEKRERKVQTAEDQAVEKMAQETTSDAKSLARKSATIENNKECSEQEKNPPNSNAIEVEKNDALINSNQGRRIKVIYNNKNKGRPKRLKEAVVERNTAELHRQKIKEDVQLKVKKRQMGQQEKMSKKRAITSMNEEASYLQMKQEKQLLEEAAKDPSVDVDKRNLHSSTNITGKSNDAKLISKLEYLNLKKVKSQVKDERKTNKQTEKKSEPPVQSNVNSQELGSEFQQSLNQDVEKGRPKNAELSQQNAPSKRADHEIPNTPLVIEILKTNVPTKQTEKEPKPSIQRHANLENLGKELQDYLNQTNQETVKSQKTQNRPQQQNNANSESQKDLFKRIDQELHKTDMEHHKLSNEIIHFKVNKIAKLIVNDKNISKELKQTLETKNPDSEKETANSLTPTESRQQEVDKMMELKTKNKMIRRIKSPVVKNMMNAKAVDNKKDPEKAKTDKELQNVYKSTKRKHNYKENLKGIPKFASKIKKTYCKRLILPMRKPSFVFKELLESYDSTLDKPVSNEIKKIPKEILEMEKKAAIRSSDPLAKYRHLKITYMTVPRVPKKREKFLLTSDNDSSQAHKRIINFRFELLKQLNEEFRKQQELKSLNAPANYDKLNLQNVKNDEKKPKANLENDDMNAAKVIETGAKALGQKKPDGVKFTNKSKTPKKLKKDIFKATKDDGNDKSGARSYSTNTDECKGSENKDDSNDLNYKKIDLCQEISESTKVHFANESPSEPDDSFDCTTFFDITRAVPHAFDCPSPQLEEERQENLYYRYHKMTMLDIHEFLSNQRAFAIDAAAAEKATAEKIAAAEQEKQKHLHQNKELNKNTEQGPQSSDCKDSKS